MRFSKAAVGLALGLVLAGSVGSGEAAEIGEDDFRISNVQGGDANDPKVAFNSQDRQYLVIWEANDDAFGIGSEVEVYGQIVDADSGDLVGGPFRISNTGVDGNGSASINTPDIAYNATNNEYLVVWNGDPGTDGLADNENEIFGQRLSAAGEDIGGDFRISDMGPLGDPNFDAGFPHVAYNSETNEYLVVWQADDNTGGLSDNQVKAFGQRINAETGVAVGDDDFRISISDSDGGSQVAFNAVENEYLIVWSDRTEIFAQRLDASGGKIGSEASIGNKSDGDEFVTSVAHNALNNEFMVVWDDVEFGVDFFQDFGQRLDATASPIGDDDFQVSNARNGADDTSLGEGAVVIYNSANNEYLAAWDGDLDFVSGDSALEIFAQRLDASTGGEIGGDFQVSVTEPDGDAFIDAAAPHAAYDPVRNVTFVVWRENDNDAIDDREISGQFLRDAKCGNGVVEAEGSETCDDGNLTAGDGCDASCLVEDAGGGGAGNNGGGCSLIR